MIGMQCGRPQSIRIILFNRDGSQLLPGITESYSMERLVAEAFDLIDHAGVVKAKTEHAVIQAHAPICARDTCRG